MALQMASTEGSGPPNSPNRRLSSRGGRRRAAQGMAIVLFVGGGLWGTLWWQERPIRLANSQLQAGQRDASYETISQFLHDHPDHHRALAIKARILVEEGKSEAALNIFDRVGAPEPQDMHALAKALLHQERWSQALPLLEFVETTGIDRADLLYELAACRMRLGMVDQALAAADEFTKQPGFEARGELLKGTIHQQRGNLRQAAASWDRVLKLSPEVCDLQIPPEEFFLEYGRVLLAMGESALAETNIQRSLKIRQTPMVWFPWLRPSSNSANPRRRGRPLNRRSAAILTRSRPATAWRGSICRKDSRRNRSNCWLPWRVREC